MKSIAAAVVLLGSLLLVQGCGSANGSDPNQGIAIRGDVIAVGELSTAPGTLMLVEGKKEEDTKYEKASVSVPKKSAKVYKMEDGKKKKASAADLKSGQRVEIKFTGDVQETSPVQAEAKEVVIIEGGASTATK